MPKPKRNDRPDRDTGDRRRTTTARRAAVPSGDRRKGHAERATADGRSPPRRQRPLQQGWPAPDDAGPAHGKDDHHQ